MPTDNVLADSARLWDETMLRILKQGGMRVQTGTDDDGNAIIETIDIPAALLSAFERRLHHCGMSASPGLKDGKNSTVAQHIARLREAGTIKMGPMPPLSEKDDAATRATG